MKIDFFTFITKGSYEYAEFLKDTAEKHKSGKHIINYKYIESGKQEKLPKGWENVYCTESDDYTPDNHGVAINEALRRTTTKYCVFADCDIAILYKGWDKYFVDKLNAGYDIVGGAHPKPVGTRPTRRFNNMPTIRMMAFDVEKIRSTGIDFKPRKSVNGKLRMRGTINHDTSYIYQMSPGDVITYDTGYQVAEVIYKYKLKYIGFECVPIISDRFIMPFQNMYLKEKYGCSIFNMCEWHLNGKLFATHKHASRRQGLHRGQAKVWYERIIKYMEFVDKGKRVPQYYDFRLPIMEGEIKKIKDYFGTSLVWSVDRCAMIILPYLDKKDYYISKEIIYVRALSKYKKFLKHYIPGKSHVFKD